MTDRDDLKRVWHDALSAIKMDGGTRDDALEVLAAAKKWWQNEALERAAKDFDETVCESWHHYEVADRLRALKVE